MPDRIPTILAELIQDPAVGQWLRERENEAYERGRGAGLVQAKPEAQRQYKIGYDVALDLAIEAVRIGGLKRLLELASEPVNQPARVE